MSLTGSRWIKEKRGQPLSSATQRAFVWAKTDLVFINLESVRMSTFRDPIRNFVYAGTEEDMDRVVIDGRTVVEGGVVLGMDGREIALEM